MAPVPDGVYQFQDQLGLLTCQVPSPGSPVVVGPPGSGAPPVWQIENNDDGTARIRLAFGPTLFLGYPGSPTPGMPVVATPGPIPWELRPGFDDRHVIIAAPGGEGDLVVDLGLMRTFPARTALMPSQPGNPAQNWYLDDMTG